MTNMEHYRAEIEAIADYNFAMTEGKITPCAGTACSECEFFACGRCLRTYWMMAEYKEPATLTAADKALVSILTDGYVVRDEDGDLFWHFHKPSKDDDEWLNGGACMKLSHLGFKREFFNFIKWEDEEPWSVEELRKLPALEYNPEDVAFKGGAE